jgi:hypothetical protein
VYEQLCKNLAYSLVTPGNPQKALFEIYGPSNNGKSAFQSIFMQLHELVGQASVNVLCGLQQTHDSVIYPCIGKHLVFIDKCEQSQHRQISASKINRLVSCAASSFRMPGQAAVSAAPKFTLIAVTNAMLQLDAPATEARFIRFECLAKFVDDLPANALTELQPDGRTYKKKDPEYSELECAAPQAAWRQALVHWAGLWYQQCFHSSGALVLDRTIDACFDDSMKQSPQSLSLKDGLEAVFDLPESLGEDELQASRVPYADAKKLLKAVGVRESDLTKNNLRQDSTPSSAAARGPSLSSCARPRTCGGCVALHSKIRHGLSASSSVATEAC